MGLFCINGCVREDFGSSIERYITKYFTKNIFDPLEMNETKFTVPLDSEHRLMTTYEFDQENSQLHGQKLNHKK